MTVLFVTHDQEEALVLSDRIVVMRDGRIEQQAAPRELYARPSNRFVADFVGESNLLPCRMQSGQIRFGDCVLRRETAAAADCDCWVMIRPELIDLADPQSGLLRGRLQETVFDGDMVRHVVDVTGTKIVVKKTHTGRPMPANGSLVSLSWSEQDMVVLAE